MGGTVSSVIMSSSPIGPPPCAVSCRVNMSTTGGTAGHMCHTDQWAGDSLEYSAEL